MVGPPAPIRWSKEMFRLCKEYALLTTTKKKNKKFLQATVTSEEWTMV
jgi:hypothetical protein